MSQPDHSDEFPSAPVRVLKGRGALSNIQGRHEVLAREACDDGWQSGHDWHDEQDEATAQLRTVVTPEEAKSILTRNASPDIPFTVSLNPYRGCEHACIYCFARPSHSYLGLSPGLDFESRIFAKTNAPELLRKELASKQYRPEPIALGVNTDAYQPCERRLGLTRKILEVLHECEHPVGLITKSSLVERDIDLLAPMAARQQAMVAITITTLDADIARKLEPRATAPERRLRAIRTLTEAGIPVAVSVAPVIPFITEPDLERIIAAAADAGAISAGYIVLRLPWEVNPLFQEWLATHFPDRAQRVMNRVRDMRGGRDYDASFGVRKHGTGVWADLIRQRFEKATARAGLNSHSSRFNGLDASRFRAPTSSGQLDLF